MVADSMQLMPTTEPMDRSMLPVISTKDWPMPVIRVGAIWRSRLPTFLPEKKDGFRMPNTMHSTTRPIVTVTTWPMPRMAIIRETEVYKRQLYLDIIRHMNNIEIDIAKIKQDISEKGEARGAFLCEYEIFKELYRLSLIHIYPIQFSLAYNAQSVFPPRRYLYS